MSRTLALAGALALTVGLTACAPGQGGQGFAAAPPPTVAQSSPAEPPAPDPTVVPTPAAPASELDSALAPAHAVAVADGSVSVHPSPDLGTAALELAPDTAFGSRRTFRVLEATPDGQWLKVVVPARGETTGGWISAATVQLEAVRHHIAVDLSDRTLVLSEAGTPVMTVTVAVGSVENPTPTGQFFITDKLNADASGSYGPYAFGLSAWSPTLSEFGGGDGQIGLHGTNRPELLGQAVSHGCIRVPNDVVTELAAVLALGVPVDIQA